MMITYFLNWMGPVNRDFIKKYGSYWSAGRIDCDDGSDYGFELSVPPMHNDDWESLSKFLRYYSTERPVTLNGIVLEYEKSNPTILWLNKEDYLAD